MITLTAADADRRAVVAVGDDIQLVLDENRTTGFRWAIESISGPLTLVSSDFDPSGSERPGAGGHRRIVLRADAAGAGDATLRYERAWEAGTGEVRHLTFSFTIKSA